MFRPLAKKTAFEKPIIDKPVKEENVLADPFLVRTFDLKTVGPTEPYDVIMEKDTLN